MSLTAPSHHVTRRYDLDWLRVLAFGLLIFYHIGLLYVNWGYHVTSQYASDVPEPYLLVLNPWRLALLFLISGVAVRFATDKAASQVGYVKSRLFRLGVPILFGSLVIVAPQSYFELTRNGEFEGSYLDFYPHYLNPMTDFSVITPTWNHLWYVVYLLVYILLISPFLPLLRRLANGPAVTGLIGGPWRLLLFVPIPFLLYNIYLSPHYPITMALWGDWTNHAHRFTMFLLGYLMAKNSAVWIAVGRVWPIAAFAAVATWAYRFGVDFYWEKGLSDSAWSQQLIYAWRGAMALYPWACILTLLGLAQRYLNKPSGVLKYLTAAVFCYYIVHQTILMSAVLWLEPYALGPWPEFWAVVGVTVVGCLISYEIVRRIPGLRLAFGVRV